MEAPSRHDMDWIRSIQWDQLASIQDGDITPWTNLWRQASFFYAHDEHFWAEATALLVGLTVVGVALLAWIISFSWSRFAGSTPPEERKLVAILEVVQLIDESRNCLQRMSETLKNPNGRPAEQPRTVPNGHMLIEDSEVTG